MSEKSGATIRGLRNFITSIRKTVTVEQELIIIEQEKAKIRKAFSEKSVTSYDLRKYCLKLMYIVLLGHEVDFGYLQATQLMSSKDKCEKLTGYTVMSVLLKTSPEFVRLVTQTILSDLTKIDQFNTPLALNLVSNVGNAEMADVLAPYILNLLTAERGQVNTPIRKKASLALLHLMRLNPDAVETAGVHPALIKLMEVRNVGFLNCLVRLLNGLSARNSAPFECLRTRAIYLLEKIVLKREVSSDHLYSGVPCPWLVISLMQFLKNLKNLPKSSKPMIPVTPAILNKNANDNVNSPFPKVSMTTTTNSPNTIDEDPEASSIAANGNIPGVQKVDYDEISTLKNVLQACTDQAYAVITTEKGYVSPLLQKAASQRMAHVSVGGIPSSKEVNSFKYLSTLNIHWAVFAQAVDLAAHYGDMFNEIIVNPNEEYTNGVSSSPGQIGGKHIKMAELLIAIASINSTSYISSSPIMNILTNSKSPTSVNSKHILSVDSPLSSPSAVSAITKKKTYSAVFNHLLVPPTISPNVKYIAMGALSQLVKRNVSVLSLVRKNLTRIIYGTKYETDWSLKRRAQIVLFESVDKSTASIVTSALLAGAKSENGAFRDHREDCLVRATNVVERFGLLSKKAELLSEDSVDSQTEKRKFSDWGVLAALDILPIASELALTETWRKFANPLQKFIIPFSVHNLDTTNQNVVAAVLMAEKALISLIYTTSSCIELDNLTIAMLSIMVSEIGYAKLAHLAQQNLPISSATNVNENYFKSGTLFKTDITNEHIEFYLNLIKSRKVENKEDDEAIVPAQEEVDVEAETANLKALLSYKNIYSLMRKSLTCVQTAAAETTLGAVYSASVVVDNASRASQTGTIADMNNGYFEAFCTVINAMVAINYVATPEMSEDIKSILLSLAVNPMSELQQRAAEALALMSCNDTKIISTILQPMPAEVECNIDQKVVGETPSVAITATAPAASATSTTMVTADATTPNLLDLF